jgi:hypothetical protein
MAMNEPSVPNTPNRLQTLAIDFILGLALLIVLGIVYGLDRQSTSPEQQKSPEAVKVTRVDEEPESPQEQEKPLRLAVTKPQYDDMGSLLKSLGGGYQYTTLELDELLDQAKIERFDVVFITCAGLPAPWFDKVLGDAERPGLSEGQLKPEVRERLRDNLRQFVERGGTLYASDLIFSLVGHAFPEFVDGSKLGTGKQQTVTAEAVDAGLRNLLGSQIDLKFDMTGWNPAAFTGQTVVVLLRGQYETATGDQAEAPLLVKFPVKEGTVVFSSFHNEKQNNELELKLLRYLVFATVLAKTEAKVTKTLVEGGFSPTARSLLSATAGAPSVTQTHHCEKAGPLRFALGFENRGAILKLTVVGPSGKKLEKEGSSSLSIDVPEAMVGDWTYTITAVRVPYENFPYALTIGQK